MKRHFWIVSYLLIVLAQPLAAGTNVIWVRNTNAFDYAKDRDSNYASDHIDVIDLATSKIVQTIKGIPKPSDLVFSPDGRRAYITSVTTEHNSYVVDTATGEIISKVSLSGRPNRPAISKDGKWLYVSIRDPGPAVPIADAPLQGLDFNFDSKDRWAKNGGALDIVDTTSLKVVKSVPTTGPLHNCYLTPDGKYVACDSPEGHNVAVIDVKTRELAWETDVHGETEGQNFRHGDPQSMSVEAGPDGSTSRLTVEIRGLRGFAVVDFATHKQVGIVKFPDQPSGFKSNGNEPHTHGDILSPDGKTRWVASQDSNAFFIYSLPELKLLGHVSLPESMVEGHPTLGCNSEELTFTPDGKTIYAVCNPGSGITPFLFALDVKTLKVVSRLPIPGHPGGATILARP